MKYDLIFYISKRTGYCERRVRKRLAEIEGEPHRIVSATSPTALGEEVSHSLRLTNLAVIVGGLGTLEDDNLATVLSRVFSNTTLTLDNMRRLTADNGENGYIIRYKTQMILALPDHPDAIDEMLTPELLSYIRDKIALPAEHGSSVT